MTIFDFRFIIIISIFLLALNKLTFSDSITVDGIERDFIVHLPAGNNTSIKIPLVICLHGGGGQGKGMNRLTSFSDVADKNMFAVVYPDGIKKNWNDGRNVTKKTIDGAEVNDVKFISSLIDSMILNYNIDSSRVYVTGISNGGIMSFRLACELSEKIAAIAAVASSMTEEETENCKNSVSLPVMIIFGDADPLVPFDGGDIKGKRGKVIPVKETVNFWIKNNGCSETPSEHSVTDNEDDETSAEKFVYQGKSDVIFWLIKGGGHTWPGGWQYLPKLFVGRTSKEINASEEIWKFFSDKKLQK